MARDPVAAAWAAAMRLALKHGLTFPPDPPAFDPPAWLTADPPVATLDQYRAALDAWLDEQRAAGSFP